MNKSNINKTKEVITDLYWEHKRTYAFICSEDKNINLDDVSEEDIAPYLSEDFSDKDFTDEEINEILSGKRSASSYGTHIKKLIIKLATTET